MIGGLSYARELGCKTAALACVPSSRIGKVAELAIEPVTALRSSPAPLVSRRAPLKSSSST